MLLLDSEALSAIAHGPAVRRDRVRALVTSMRARQLPVAAVASVVADVVRGRPADAGVLAALTRDRVQVRTVDARTGIRVGQLLGRTGAGSEMAVDAFTVAVADLAAGAVIATADIDDFERLAATAESSIRIVGHHLSRSPPSHRHPAERSPNRPFSETVTAPVSRSR